MSQWNDMFLHIFLFSSTYVLFLLTDTQIVFFLGHNLFFI